MADLTLREAEILSSKMKSYGLKDVRIEFSGNLSVSCLMNGIRWSFTEKKEACSFLDALAKEGLSN